MGREKYYKEIKEWLALRNSGLGIRKCFEKTVDGKGSGNKTPLSHTAWLVMPGEEKKAGLKRELSSEWNDILFTVFANTPKYRQEDSRLWERLERLERSILQDMETDRSYRLSDRPVPKTGQGLVGRKRELLQIAGLLETQHYVFLHGIGGIGKSAVARAYAVQYSMRYDTVVYAPCDGNLRELFADDEKIPVENMSFVPAGKRGERGWYVRRKLNALKKITDDRTLIIVDNLDVVTDDFIEDVLKLPCHLLFTTRTDPACFGRTGLEIRALADKRELLALFSLYYGEVGKEEEADVESLLHRFQGHTLYVKLLARHCAVEGVRPSEIRQGKPDMAEYVFDLQELPGKEQQVLKNAALLPVAGMKLDRFLLLSGNGVSEAQIQMLRRRGLVEYDASGGQIVLHSLVRHEVEEVLRPDWYGCRNFISGFVGELKDFWDRPVKSKMQFQTYILRVLEALPPADTRFIEYAFVMTDLLWQLGQWEQAVQYNEELYRICDQTFGSPHPYTARAAHQVASVWHNRQEKEKAAPWFERTWLAYRDLPDKEPGLEALYQMKYNRYFVWKGEYGKAEECLFRAESIYLKAIESAEGFKALGGYLINTYIEHTRVCIEQKKYEDALEWCEKGQKLAVAWKEGGATKAYIYHDAAVIWKHLKNRERYRLFAEKAKNMAELFLVEGHFERIMIEQEWKQCMCEEEEMDS